MSHLVYDNQEPLRASISSQLRNSLQGLTISGELLEQAVQLVTNDNLDLGCAVIEQAATEKVPQLHCNFYVLIFFMQCLAQAVHPCSLEDFFHAIKFKCHMNRMSTVVC